MGDFFEYKGNYYMILGECQFKDPSSREWIEAFEYTLIKDGLISDLKFVREKKEFLKRFRKVDLFI